MTRILLADDHPMIGAALDMLLRGTGYEFVARARTGTETLAQIKRLQPDLLLLDVHMPEGTGIDVLRQLQDSPEKPAVVLLTAGMDDSLLLVADDLEPDGIILKTSDPALLLECIEAVTAGRQWIDPEISARIKDVRKRAEDMPALTPRERQLVDLVRRGMRNRDIAAELGVTEGTVKVYLHSIFDKVGVANRTELAMRAASLVGA